MPMTRRALALGITAVALVRPGLARGEAERALFWRVAAPDKSSGVVFGYERMAASVVPDIVQDGVRLIEQSSRVALDYDNLTLPPVRANGILPPIMNKVTLAIGSELRQVLAAMSVPPAQIDSIAGVAAAMLLYGEGQTKPMPSVGGVIVSRAKALGRPVAPLLGADEVAKLRKPVTLDQLDAAIDEKSIAFLLDLRRKAGPIGAHCEKLYLARQGEDLSVFTKGVADHGMPGPASFIDEQAIREMLFARIPGALAQKSANQQTFFVLPLGILTGPDGLLKRLNAQGISTAILA